MLPLAAVLPFSVVLCAVSGSHPQPDTPSRSIILTDFTGLTELDTSHKLPSSSLNEVKAVELVVPVAVSGNYSRLAALPPPGLLQGSQDVLGHLTPRSGQNNFASEFEDHFPQPQPSGGRGSGLQERQDSVPRPLQDRVPGRGASRGRPRPDGSRRPPSRARQQQGEDQDLQRQLQQQLVQQLQQQPRPQLTPSHPDISVIPLQPLQDHDGANDWPGERFPPYIDSFPPFPPQPGASATLPPPQISPQFQASHVQQNPPLPQQRPQAPSDSQPPHDSQTQRGPRALQSQGGPPQAPLAERAPQISSAPQGLQPHRAPHNFAASQSHKVPPVTQALHVVSAPQLTEGLTVPQPPEGLIAPQPPEGLTAPQVSSVFQAPENFQIVQGPPQAAPQLQGSQVHRIPRGPRIPRIPLGPQVLLRRPLRGTRPLRPGRTPHRPRNHFRGPRLPQAPSSRDSRQTRSPVAARPEVQQPPGEARVLPSRRPSHDVAHTSSLSSGEVVASRKEEGREKALEINHPTPTSIVEFTRVPNFIHDFVEKSDIIEFSHSDVVMGQEGVRNSSKHPSRAGRKGSRPGVVETLRNKLPRSLGLSKAGRNVQKRLERLVGGAAARASLVGQVAGELLGAGVVAASQAGHALGQAMSTKHAEGPPSYETHTFASGLQLTVPHEDHVTQHRFGVRFDLSSRYPGSLLPVVGLGIDTNVLARRLPDGQDPPPAFLAPYTHADSRHHVLPSHHGDPHYPHTHTGGHPNPPIHYGGPDHPPVRHGSPPLHQGGPPQPPSPHSHENYFESYFSVDHLPHEPRPNTHIDISAEDSHVSTPHLDGQLDKDYTHSDQSKYIPEPPDYLSHHSGRPKPRHRQRRPRHCISGRSRSVARVYIPGPQPYVGCGRELTPPHHHKPSPVLKHNHGDAHDYPDSIDEIKEIINDPSYPAEYYRESYRPKDLRSGRSRTKNPISNPAMELRLPNMKPAGLDIEAELNPYTGAEDLRQSIAQKEDEFIVLDAISQGDQESYFDEVLVFQDEGQVFYNDATKRRIHLQ